MTKLFVICNYENRSLLSQKLETLSQNYDLILPFWFEKGTNIDRESFLEDVNRVRNCDFVSNTIYVCKEENNTKEIQRYLMLAISFLIETFCLKMKNYKDMNLI